MGRNKMIAKSCPKCGMHVAVASKSCKCGHTFFAARRAADSLSPLPVVEDTKRRTGRVRRSCVYYDAHAGIEIRRQLLYNYSTTLPLPVVEDTKRRTERVRRSRPFYDAHAGKQIRRQSSNKSYPDESYKGKEKESATAVARRRRALRRSARPRVASAERLPREAPPVLQPAQLARCAIVLQEINRKMRAVTWQPSSQ